MNIRKISYTALFTALAVILHYVEGLIPLPVPIIGFKLGLANIVGVFTLFYLGWSYYVISNVARVLLVALLSTGFGMAFFLSVSGMVLSTVASILLFKFSRCSIFGISTVSAFFHVLGQVLMYILITLTPYLISYLPILASLSMLAGFILAFLSKFLLERLPPVKEYGFASNQNKKIIKKSWLILMKKKKVCASI